MLVTPEDPLHVLGSDADAVIHNDEACYRTFRLDGDFDWPSVTELERVGEQVSNDLLHTNPIPAADDGSRRGNLDVRPGSSRFFAEATDHVTHEGGQIDFLALEPKTPRRDSRNIHELSDKSSKTLCLPVRHLQLRLDLLRTQDGLGRSARWLKQRLDLQLQRREWRPQFVRSHGQKLVPRADGIDRLAVEKLAFELGALPLRDVARDRNDALGTDANKLQGDVDRNRRRMLPS